MKIAAAICLTALSICFGRYATDYMIEYQKGQQVRDLLKLQQLYQQPSITIPGNAKDRKV
jgi:hypothetical protein